MPRYRRVTRLLVFGWLAGERPNRVAGCGQIGRMRNCPPAIGERVVVRVGGCARG
ncbi:hypothetical protein [Virgisporangium aurantiacum]|uniref:hypothetical protein n=1 Tax=Virgisporangium aurantiacum TaxID=175570 RepID=UPI00194F673D|nr:hypothetical protein [Virgisporangium aurantiacum]